MPEGEFPDRTLRLLEELRAWVEQSQGDWSRFDLEVFEGLPDQFRILEHERRHDGKPFICDFGGFRSLHFSSFHVQSQMDVRSPLDLMFDYTCMMMGFLLFQPTPASIEMIGLGGGSLAKYYHHTLPGAYITIAEIDPDVIALRDRFQIPADSNRFRIIQEDGADFVLRYPGVPDVLMVDGFDRQGQSTQLCTIQFYEACRTRLAQNGLMVVNLSGFLAEKRTISDRITNVFGEHVLSVATEGGRNRTMFAGKGLPQILTKEMLAEAVNRVSLVRHPFLAAIGRRILRSRRLAEPRNEVGEEARDSPLLGPDQPITPPYNDAPSSPPSSHRMARGPNSHPQALEGQRGIRTMDGKRSC